MVKYLHVSPATFQRMKKAEMLAGINGEDGAVAAMKVAELPLYSRPECMPYFHETVVRVTMKDGEESRLSDSEDYGS